MSLPAEEMTIDVLSIQNNKLVLRVNMRCSNLYCKILSDLTDEEFEKWLLDFDVGEDMTLSDTEFIEKVWNACVAHGYISEDYILGKFLDKMEIII